MATLYSTLYTDEPLVAYDPRAVGNRPTMCQHARRGYVADGLHAVQVWDGMAATSADAGIAGPSREVAAWAPAPSEGTGTNGITVGTHLVRYRYKDSRTGFVSDPSNTYSLAQVNASKKRTFNVSTSGATNMIRSTTTRVDRLIVEMTLAGGTVFFVAADVAQTVSSVDVDITDRSLVAFRLPWPSDGHLPPPIVRHVFSYRGRLWYYGQIVYPVSADFSNGSTTVTAFGTSTWPTAFLRPTTAMTPSQRTRRLLLYPIDAKPYEVDHAADTTHMTLVEPHVGTITQTNSSLLSLDAPVLYYSAPGYPESVPLTNFVTGPGLEPIKAAIGVLNGILLFGVSTMHYLRYTDEPGLDGSMRQVSADRGSVGHAVTVNVDDVVYTLDRNGITEWSGGGPVPISRPIESVIRRIAFNYEGIFHACYYPRAREVRWFVALDAQTTPLAYLAWNVVKRIWTMGTLEVAAYSSALVQTGTATRAVIGDANGHVWLDDAGTTVGVATGCTGYPKGLVAAGATVTVVPFSNLAGLPTAGVAMTGVTVHFERLNETRVIASNTTSGVTVSPGFTSAPVVGDVLWFGRVKALLKTKCFTFDSKEKHKGRFVHVWFKPLASQRYVRVRIYRDWSATAMSWSEADWRRTGTPPRGTLYPDPDDANGGGTDWKVDVGLADGVARIPLGDQAVRVTEVEVEVFQADCRVELLGVTVDADPIASLV